jgi:hypothetical protein
VLERPYKFLVHIGTVAGILYLVWSSLFATTAALSFVYSDAGTALENPIAIQNKSDLFSIRNIVWVCRIIDASYGPNINFSEGAIAVDGNISVIEPGRSMNIACSKKGASTFVRVNAKLQSAHIMVYLSYDADFFGLWYHHHKSIAVPFTWVGNITQPQWVQWDFVR